MLACLGTASRRGHSWTITPLLLLAATATPVVRGNVSRPQFTSCRTVPAGRCHSSAQAPRTPTRLSAAALHPHPRSQAALDALFQEGMTVHFTEQFAAEGGGPPQLPCWPCPSQSKVQWLRVRLCLNAIVGL